MVASALAAPQVPILTRSEIRDDLNQYSLSYSTGDGQAATAQGALKPNADRTGNVLVQQGSYAYIGTDGRLYKLSYIADELGFRPTADFLPTPPPALEVVV